MVVVDADRERGGEVVMGDRGALETARGLALAPDAVGGLAGDDAFEGLACDLPIFVDVEEFSDAVDVDVGPRAVVGDSAIERIHVDAHGHEVLAAVDEFLRPRSDAFGVELVFDAEHGFEPGEVTPFVPPAHGAFVADERAMLIEAGEVVVAEARDGVEDFGVAVVGIVREVVRVADRPREDHHEVGIVDESAVGALDGERGGGAGDEALFEECAGHGGSGPGGGGREKIRMTKFV